MWNLLFILTFSSLDSDVLQKNVQIVWMFDVTRYKYCDADSGGGGKNAQYLKMNILLDMDWYTFLIYMSSSVTWNVTLFPLNILMFYLFAANSFPAGTALYQVS